MKLAHFFRVHTVWKVREESTFYTKDHGKSGKVREFENLCIKKSGKVKEKNSSGK